MSRNNKQFSLIVLFMLVMSMVLAACGNAADQTAVVGTATNAVGPALETVDDAVNGGNNTPAATTGADTTPEAPVATGTVAVTPGATGAASPVATGTAGQGAGGPQNPGDTSKGELTIYASLPLTGSSLGQTQTIVNGMKLALQQFGGAAGGYKVNFTALDDATVAAGKWTPEKEAENANKAITDKATVYLGTYNSGAAAISIPLLNKAGIPMVSPANTAPELTKKGFDDPTLNRLYAAGPRNYFRVVPADDLQGAAGANWSKQLGATNVYILHDNEVYGKGIATVFRNQAKQIGLKEAGFEAIDPKASSFQALMQKVVNSGADMVYFGGLTQTKGPQLLKDLRSQASNDEVKFMGPDGINESAFIEAAGEDIAEGVYSTFAGGPYDKLQGKGAQFYRDYKATYNSEPEAYAIFGYDAMYAALLAIDKAGSKDPKDVLNALENLGEIQGAVGTFSFDENGDTTLTIMNGYQVQGGKFVWQTALSAKAEE